MHGGYLRPLFPRCVQRLCIAMLIVEKEKWFVEDMIGNLPQLAPSTVNLSKIESSKFKRFLVYCNFILFLCVCLDVHLENEVYRLYFWCKESHRCCKVCAHYPIVPPQLVRALNDDFWKFWRVSTSIFLPSCFMKGWCLRDCLFKCGGFSSLLFFLTDPTARLDQPGSNGSLRVIGEIHGKRQIWSFDQSPVIFLHL